MRKGWKCSETYLGLLSVILTAVLPGFPVDSLAAVWTAILGRKAEKLLSEIGSGRFWQNSESWVSVAYAVAKYVFPEIPDVALVWVMGYTGIQQTVKIVKQKQERNENVQNP